MTTDPNTTPPSTKRTHRDYYMALYQAALTISSSLELDQVLQSVVMSITEAMQVKACVLRLLESQTGELYPGAIYGLSGHYLAKGPVEITHSQIDQETLQGTPVFIPDVRVDPRFQYQQAAEQEGIVSALSVPLEVHGNAIGILRVYTTEMTVFHEDDIQFLSILASISALAIENARLYDSIKSSFTGVIEAFWGTLIK